MPGKRTRPTDPAELKAFRKSGRRPSGHAAKLRAEMIFSAMIEHDGNRAKVAAQCGMTPKALNTHLERNPLVIERYQSAVAEISRKAVIIAGEQAMTKAEALVRLSKTARGHGEAWYESAGKDGEIIKLKRGPSFTEGNAAIGLMGKMNPGWLEPDVLLVGPNHADEFLNLPQEIQDDYFARHGANAVARWLDERSQRALPSPAPEMPE